MLKSTPLLYLYLRSGVSMPFKKFDSVGYQKKQLRQVICQLRFPSILAISDKLPSEFQNGIRDHYPNYSRTTEQQISLNLSPNTFSAAPKISQTNELNSYLFSAENNDWHVNLSCTSLSLATTSYTSWNDFKHRLEAPLASLINGYKPSFFDRIGLRYINIFRRSELSLSDISWNHLFQPFVIGFLSANEVRDDVLGYAATTDLSLGHGAFARVNTSLGIAETEPAFSVDNDMFCGKTGINVVTDTLEQLHSHANNILRSVLLPKLHESMEPES